MGTKDWQIGKDKFGSLEKDSEILSSPSKAQKGMKADTAEPDIKCGGWFTNSGSIPFNN